MYVTAYILNVFSLNFNSFNWSVYRSFQGSQIYHLHTPFNWLMAARRYNEIIIMLCQVLIMSILLTEVVLNYNSGHNSPLMAKVCQPTTGLTFTCPTSLGMIQGQYIQSSSWLWISRPKLMLRTSSDTDLIHWPKMSFSLGTEPVLHPIVWAQSSMP